MRIFRVVGDADPYNGKNKSTDLLVDAFSGAIVNNGFDFSMKYLPCGKYEIIHFREL